MDRRPARDARSASGAEQAELLALTAAQALALHPTNARALIELAGLALARGKRTRIGELLE